MISGQIRIMKWQKNQSSEEESENESDDNIEDFVESDDESDDYNEGNRDRGVKAR